MRKLNMKLPNKRRMLVKITKTDTWYKKGDVHEVGCYMVTNYMHGDFFYEKIRHQYGIDVTHCRIIKILPKN